MVLDCCTNERAFRRDLALTAERLCKLSRAYAGAFDDLFGKTYAAAHRLETGRLRNAAAFFAHLVASAAVSWDVLEYVRITEADTTSSSRIFLKVFFQDLASLLGASGLREKLWAPELAEQLAGVFPREKARDVRFAVNFFTAIGLGSLRFFIAFLVIFCYFLFSYIAFNCENI